MAREQRRLAAIVCADVVGFSRLIGMDEADTLARLKALRREVIDPKIGENGGRLVKTTGDGLLVEFGSVVDAVRCAVSVQQELIQRYTGLPSDKRIEFRFGVHMGDIVIDGDDILGDGVNIAARLEALAEPGGVCVSARVHEDLAGKLDLDFRDGGEQTLKNIRRPVRVWRWASTTIATADAPAPPRPNDEPLALPDKPSIAVLPFINMSGDPDQEYFADGVVEDIITGLSRLKWLFVIARNSSFTYRGRAVDVKQIGRDLGVRYVLEGSMRKASNRVRVTGQVIETETGRHVWAERYDRTLEHIFALQDDLTTSVVAAIEPSLRQAEIERVKRKRPDNLDAYDFLLRAMSDVYPAIPERARKALPHLESAIALEADYASAHGFAAWCHEILFVHGGAHEEDRLGAIRHAHAAIENGRDDALALALGGFALGMVAHDREAARRAFDAALALSPSCSLAYAFGSVVAATGGEAERGIDWGETALRLSPIDPMRFGPCMAIAYGHLQLGEPEAAAEAARRCFQAHPNWSLTHMLLAATHARLGRLEAASEAARRLLELDPAFAISRLCIAAGLHPSIAGPLSEALHKAGLPA